MRKVKQPPDSARQVSNTTLATTTAGSGQQVALDTSDGTPAHYCSLIPPPVDS